MVRVGTVLVPVEYGLCWKRTKKQAALRGCSANTWTEVLPQHGEAFALCDVTKGCFPKWKHLFIHSFSSPA